MNNITLNIISVHLFFTCLPLELIDITHTRELYKGLMARWALNAPPVTGPSSTQHPNSPACLGLEAGLFTGPGEFPSQRPVTQRFDVFFDLRLE